LHERATIHPAFKGRLFPDEIAAALDDIAPKPAGKSWRRLQDVNEVLRTVKANFDFSPGAIQGLVLLFRHPRTWGKVTVKAFEFMFKPQNAPKWFAKPENLGIISRHPAIMQGAHEFFAGRQVIERLGAPGRITAKAIEPFERYFTTWGDAARVEIAKALEDVFVKAGQPEQLATYVNRLTGVMETRALGISGKQRAFESLALFAPRYTRASMAYIGYIFEKGVAADEARKSLAALFSGGTIFWMGMQKAMGEDVALPNSPEFWTAKMGNRRVGMGGFMYSFIRFLADVYQSAAKVGPNDPLDFTEFDRSNPIVNFLSKRASVIGQLGRGVVTQSDYLGYPLEDFETWAHWIIVEGLLPIGLQEQITGPGEEPPSDRPGLAVAELFGLRTFPVDTFHELADKYAQEQYGKDWNDLYEPTAGGTMRESKEQEALLKAHPDLQEEYDKWKPRQAKRWKYQHGLLGDEDIVRDYWARKIFGRDYDELPKQYQQVVEQAMKQKEQQG